VVEGEVSVRVYVNGREEGLLIVGENSSGSVIPPAALAEAASADNSDRYCS
jgi:hypothetical protein